MVFSTCSLGKSLAATFRKVFLKFNAVLGFLEFAYRPRDSVKVC